jgi:hypothetical protein
MTIINANDDDFFVVDGKKVLKDGKKITVGLRMMDGAPVIDPALHRPGPRFAATDTAVIDTAYAGYVADLEGAWRKPSSDAPPAAAVPPAAAARDKAYGAMVDGLTNAWRA